MDLLDNLDDEIGEGPAPRPVQTHLAAGRRALRRRRLTALGGGLVALAVVGGGAGYAATASSPHAAAPAPAARPHAGVDHTPALPTDSSRATPEHSYEPSSGPTAPGQEPLVHFGHANVLVPAPGVTILAQQGSPGFGDAFAPAGAPTAAAVVDDHGSRVYVVARVVHGRLDVLTVRNRQFSSLADFIAFARQRYADGAHRAGPK